MLHRITSISCVTDYTRRWTLREEALSILTIARHSKRPYDFLRHYAESLNLRYWGFDGRPMPDKERMKLQKFCYRLISSPKPKVADAMKSMT